MHPPENPSTYSVKRKRVFEPLSIGDLTNRIRAQRGFVTVKLCHGFWERTVRFDQFARKRGWQKPFSEEQWTELLAAVSCRWPAELFLEVVRQLKTLNDDRVLCMFSELGWPEGYAVEGTPLAGLEPTRDAMFSAVPSTVPVYDGLFFKSSLQDGSLAELLDCLRDRRVLVAGPRHTQSFAEFCRLRNATFLPVDGSRAAWQRQEILRQISDQLDHDHTGESVLLLQAGGLTSSWLALQLIQRFPEIKVLTMGRVLDIADYETLRRTNWYGAHHPAINRHCRDINPEWIDPVLRSKEHSAEASWQRRIHNLHPSISAILEQPAAEPAVGAMPFIGTKNVDEMLLTRLLRHSSVANQWANFGPVNDRLEQAMALLLELPADRSVISCKSATDGLHVLAAHHELDAGRPLRWISSAFGFFSTRIGPLAETHLLDCDPNGLLDADALSQIPATDWDGIIIVNPFDTAQQADTLMEIARDQGKRVVIDNAAALRGKLRQHCDFPDEVISFHHTKPWGFGEGGCVITHRNHAQQIRSLCNFGVGSAGEARKHARNSKLSEYDAALILQRLGNLPNWEPRYLMQRRRIIHLAKEAGLQLLGAHNARALQAYVPLLAPKPVSQKALANPYVTLRKYYRPLAPGYPQAQDIFDRIVCVPCHERVSEIDSQDLLSLFRRLAATES